MANDIYKNVLAAAKEYAIETDNTRFLAAAIEPETVWIYLDYFANYTEKDANGKDVHPFYDYFRTWGQTKPKKGQEPKVKVNRSYVSNVKSAIKRHAMLDKVIVKEDTEYYKEFHYAESEAMDAYALQVLLDIVKSDPRALDNIDAKIDAWEAEKAKAKDKK